MMYPSWLCPSDAALRGMTLDAINGRNGFGFRHVTGYATEDDHVSPVKVMHGPELERKTLEYLRARPSVQKDVALAVGCCKATMSNMIRTLVDRKLIRPKGWTIHKMGYKSGRRQIIWEVV